MLAPAYHPAFRAVVPVRKALAAEGTRTIFNIIGPLLNPAQPPFQLAGVFSAGLAETYARTFLRLGRTRAWAVHGHTSDGRGMDEVSLFGSTLAAKAADGVVAVEMIGPPERIPAPDSINQLAGGSPAVNAEILEGIVRGEVHGPKRDLSVVNAAAALVVAGLAPGLDDGCEEAEAAIDSGRAARALDAWRAFAD